MNNPTPTPMSDEQKREEMPKDILKIFMRAEKNFRQYQNCPPDYHSQKWFSVIASFDEVLGLMDTLGEYINEKSFHQGVQAERERICKKILEESLAQRASSAKDVSDQEYEDTWVNAFNMGMDRVDRIVESFSHPSKEE